MLRKLVITELIKIKKSYFIIFLLGFNLLSVLIGSVIFFTNREILLTDGNQSLVLWGQSSLYSSQIFFPILIGVFCSVSWQFEEKNKNWQRMVMIPIKEQDLVLSKFFSIQLFTLVNQITFLLLFILSAVILRVPDIRLENFILWSCMGWIGSSPITAIQLYLSIKLRNFTFPILIAAVGSILGLMTLFISDLIFNIFPYTQVNIGMRSRVLENFRIQNFSLFCFISLFFSVLGLSLSVNKLKRREE